MAAKRGQLKGLHTTAPRSNLTQKALFSSLAQTRLPFERRVRQLWGEDLRPDGRGNGFYGIRDCRRSRRSRRRAAFGWLRSYVSNAGDPYGNRIGEREGLTPAPDRIVLTLIPPRRSSSKPRVFQRQLQSVSLVEIDNK